MSKKRNAESQTTQKKSLPVEVIVQDVGNHPICIHGPALLFSNSKERFFACSLCRNRKDCTLYITENDWEKDTVKKRNEKYLQMIPKFEKLVARKCFEEVKLDYPSNRAYCLTCKDLYIKSQNQKHKDHRIVSPLSDEQLMKPSSWLPTLENNATEAQYLFAKKSIAVILATLLKNNIRNIICIGTPTIHEAAVSTPNFTSILLDFDMRQGQFHHPDQFIWYNMFNNYLFNGREDELMLKKFVKNACDSGICIVMDPPFGGRVEPLVHTVKEMSDTYNHVNERESSMLPIIWVFPYYSEPYIVNSLPGIKMHDYQVEYENHTKFQNKNSKGRKFGSPVRIFTNLPLSTIDLSSDHHYKLCSTCQYYVSITNNHCFKCESCTSKNGTTYKHCNVCKQCVKPTFKHCVKCGRCSLENHSCGLIVMSQSCFNCHEKGHKKSNCPKLNNAEPKRKRRKIK